MKVLVFAATTALTVALLAPAFAGTDGGSPQPPQAAPSPPTAAAPGAQAASAKDAQDPNQIICKTVEVTGSLLASKRTCRTRAAWEEMTRVGREATETLQNSDSGTNIPH